MCGKEAHTQTTVEVTSVDVRGENSTMCFDGEAVYLHESELEVVDG